MSELHCPARFIVFSDADAPPVVAALGRERVALQISAADEPRLGSARTVGEALDDIADRYRGECVAVQLDPAVREALAPQLAGVTADRTVVVVD